MGPIFSLCCWIGAQNTPTACRSLLCLIQPMRLRSLILLVPACTLAVLAIGCDALVDRPGLVLEFGSPYNVLFGQSVTAVNGLTHSTPFTDTGGGLHVAVEFSGGCANHSFRADYTLAEATATIWLVHASNGDACLERLAEEVVVALPATVLEKETLILISPSGREEAIARFDAPIEGP